MKYKYYDQHVHNNYSYDSKETPENYFIAAKKLGLDAVYFTNHFDLDVSRDEPMNWSIDFAGEDKEYAALEAKYPEISIRRGIEIGYNHEKLDELKEVIDSHKFNQINLSMHYWDHIDFYDPKEFEGQIDKILKIYFDAQIVMANSDFDYDVFCHIDYGFKTPFKVNRTLDFTKYEKQVIEIFKGIIAHGKVFEINTKVQETLNDVEHVRYLLRLYKSLGGELLSVSSDAHSKDRLCASFDKYIDIIKEEGFTKLVYFIDRKKYFYSLLD